MWHEPGQQMSAGGVKDVSFLVSRQERLHRTLRLADGDSLYLDGPYGQDHSLGRYETVILTAKGVGIAGVLSSALNLLERREHDSVAKDQMPHTRGPRLFRDATRKVSIFWVLEHASQQEWVASELKSLQGLDEDNIFLLVWLMYQSPESSTRPPPFKVSRY
ncbi:hypothetical protein M406DRAFT_326813 [Cryphonectria parasitica EP155]|uniref:Ferric reductase NAD binding domain-containing protein n=1 Tax=Cryphonectria parasitica (strain ATCC 38755 / EP155) TaxID=660469 RepID=A0A9P5CR60_CRYP1|nr:uncharacterized protein M406DRAFT_326813 [Cryphonectria parasitica EP155]KAF3768214.1 hypothetical protein M406DRAFT_326813 [Cryphonectria parasitica EP155]